MVIQAGICGSLNDNLQPGDVVAVKSEIIGDAGVQQNGAFHSLFKLHLCQPDQAPWAEERLTNPYPLLNECSWPLVNAVSVNEISTDLSRIDYYKSVLDAQIESMEGAALHYVCLMEKIPFLQLRSVSNKIAERDKQKWKVNLAIENLNRALLSLIKQVAHEN